MNENTLILTEHRVLPRLVDAGLTLLAWLGFLFFLYANLLMQFIAPPSPRWESLMDSLNTALVYLLIAALNGWLLILWYHYNRAAPIPGVIPRCSLCATMSWRAALTSRRRLSRR